MEKDNAIEKWANLPAVELDGELASELDEALETLYYPELQQFVVFALTRKSTPERIKDALGAFKVGMEYLIARGYYHKGYEQSKGNNTFFASLLVHNVFFDFKTEDASSWLKVFELRDKMESLAFKLYDTMDYNERGMFEYVFQNVEAQLGETMPTAGNRPVRGQTTEMFWNVLWFYYHFTKEAE